MIRNFSVSRAVVLAIVALPVAAGSTASAQSSSDPQVRQAARYLDDAKHQKSIFSILHFGATPGTYELASLHGVTNAGRTVPGEFAIKVVYDWDTSLGKNTTTATYFFDKNGYVSDIDARSTSIFSPPFELANATIQVVGDLLISVATQQGASQKQLDDMRQFVHAADSKGLLMLSMNVQMLAGL